MARVEFLETVIGTGHIPTSDDGERQQVSDGPIPGFDVWSQASILPAVALVEQGTWVERDECLLCGRAKGGGRKSMTCDRCKVARSAAIKGGVKPGIPQCLNCGADKGAGGLLLICSKCRPAARAAGY